jgi:hypothetical protein
MQQLRGDVDRVDSNVETHKKHVDQKFTKVDNEIDDVKGELKGSKNSWASMQKHTEVLTKGLVDMMQRMNDLRFDMPNQFDTWLKVRLGNEGGLPSTVASRDLDIQWPGMSQFPSTAPLDPPPLPPSAPQNFTPVLPPSDPVSDAERTQSSHPSSTDLYRQYMRGSSVLVEGREEGISGGVIEEAVPPSDSNALDRRNQDDVQGPAMETQEAGQVKCAEASEAIAVTVSPPHLGEGESSGITDTTSTPMLPTSPSIPVIPSPTVDNAPKEGDVKAPDDGGTLSVPSLPSPSRASVPVTDAVAATSASATSANINRSPSVDPSTSTLDANFLHVSPPSSQPPVSSPTPQPDTGLLQVPADLDPQTPLPVSQTGPVTRSRSRSLSESLAGSTSTGPITRSRSRSPGGASNVKVRKKSKGKGKSRRG